ncbi:hypothetical protein [Streptomyces sp. NBC_00151]|uniref:hypothetical protein n=1 Tax=Streptomyces sp. NBC_00151 TaxID=2975669 RepID=UPI002DD90105|nr:hypothetical protein [Streptomyces sp. NBC_00151]WRZ37426.1 hypothetical protein OG915_04800 [Streptomyces sp. NBC_00151]
MTNHDAAREHALHDDGTGEHAIHARIAHALATLSNTADGTPPPPYARRHLARHAQRGGVLDDARVPPQALAWDTGGGIRGLLQSSPSPGPRHWLTAWSVVEPYLRDADLPSRISSLRLAHTALHHARTPRSRLPGDEAPALGDGPLTAVWADWQPASNVLAMLPSPAVSLSVLPPSGHSGPHLAAGTTDGSIHFLDLHTTQFTAAQNAHTGEVRHLHTTGPDREGCHYLISASTDGTLRLWDARHHTHLDHLTDTTWIDDTASFYDQDGRLTVLSVNGRSELTQWIPPGRPQLRRTEEPALKGAVAALVDEHGVRRIVHATHQLTFHTSPGPHVRAQPLAVPARTLAVGSEPDRFYCGHADGSITAWSTTHGQLDTVPGHGEPVKDLITLTLDGRPIVAAARGSHILLWDPATRATGQLTGHWSAVTALTALTQDTGRAAPPALVSAATDATLRQWPADLLRHALAGATTERPTRPAAAALLTTDATCLAASPEPTGIGVWDLHTGTRTPIPADAPALAMTWAERAAQTPLLLWSDITRSIHGWDPATGRTTTVIADSEARTATMTACRTPQGPALLLAAGDDYRTRLWNLDTATLIRTWRPQPRSIKTVTAAADRDGQLWLATGGTDGVARLWDPQQSERCSAELRCDQGLISALALHPEATESLPPFLATGGDQGPVRLWNLHTHESLDQQLAGAAGPIDALTAFSSGQHAYVAAAARDGLVRIWHAASTHCILTLATGAPVTRLDATSQTTGNSVHLSLSSDAGILVTQIDLGHRALTH